MSDFSNVLQKIDDGDPQAMGDLLNLVYGELHAIAKFRVSNEKSDLTLQATDLVNEAYLRLFGASQPVGWENRAHFFGAASEAMRRILVDHARKKRSLKRGGDLERVEFSTALLAVEEKREELLAVHDALDEFEKYEKQAARLVKLRYFVGMEHREAADALGISKRVADRLWLVAKAWLFNKINEGSSHTPEATGS